ncbi:hypothetical protein MMC25_004617 [Agyrium rufum]|nr:hypothetical protein [Agyrium rufum]
MLSKLALLLLPLTSAHFLLNYPPTLGFDDDNEGISPCGGADIKFDMSTDVMIPVGGFPIQLQSTHPQANWLFRATLDQQAPFNWTDLLPVVTQSGLGDFCIPDLMAPESFAGKMGLVQIIQDAVDGELFQCSAVMFMTGTNSSVSSSCKNVTGLAASVLPGSSSFSMPAEATTMSSMDMSSMTMTSGMPSSTGAVTAAATSPSSAPAARATGAIVAGLGVVLAGIAAL